MNNGKTKNVAGKRQNTKGWKGREGKETTEKRWGGIIKFQTNNLFHADRRNIWRPEEK